MRGTILAAAALATAIAVPLPAQEAEFKDRFGLIGLVQSRASQDIASSNWSVGAETMDRDLSTYSAWRAYLGPLGVKRARIQSGWAKTDNGKSLDFGWLDPIVSDMRAQGVAPWMSLSFGNPAYEGGGVKDRESALPTGPGREAWLRYVKATVSRYRTSVTEWELWNEPNVGLQGAQRIEPEQYADFAYETAKAIKSVQPNAYIILGAFATQTIGDPRTDKAVQPFAMKTFDRLSQLKAKGLFSAVSYHLYFSVPERAEGIVRDFRKVVDTFDPAMQMRQGEGGAPSINQQVLAMSNLWWTEESQAKFALRRMLSDLGSGVVSSIFTISDIHYLATSEGTRGGERVLWTKNTKGLLETKRWAPGTAQEDRSIYRPRMAYEAVRNLTAIFDNKLSLVPGTCTGPAGSAYEILTFRTATGAHAVAIWRTGDRPGDRPLHESINVTCKGFTFGSDPLYVDLLTGGVYKTTGVAVADAQGVQLRQLPAYDSPVVLLDNSLVQVR